MRWSAIREYATLCAISGANGMGLLIPLFLGDRGHPIAIIGLMAGLGGVATLLSRFAVPFLYRPERSVALLVLFSVAGAVSAVVLPMLSNLVLFGAVFFVNRAVSGIATSVYLARFLDTLDENADRRAAMGFYGGTQALGYATTSLVIGFLADLAGYLTAFLYAGAIAALGGLLLVGTRPPRRRLPRARADRVAAPEGLRQRMAAMADPGLWGVLNTSFWNMLFHAVQASFVPVLGLAVGLSAGQVGIVRAAYAGINAVARPIAGLVMHGLTLRQATYLGMGMQTLGLVLLPFLHDFALFVVFALLAGMGRAVVIVAATVSLAEDVDETRVSRGLSTAAYSTSSDLPTSVGPLVAGFVATAVGISAMFPIMAVVAILGFAGGDAAMLRWRARLAAAAGREQGPALS